MKNLTPEEIAIFNQEYNKSLMSFIEKHELLLWESLHDKDSNVHKYIITTSNNQYRHHYFKEFNKGALIDIYEKGEINFYNDARKYEALFFVEHYKNIEDKYKNVLLNISNIDLTSISQALKNKPEEIVHFIKATGLTKVCKTNSRYFSMRLNALYDFWYKYENRNDFNLLSKNLFYSAKKYLKNERVEIAFKYILSKYPHDESIKNELENLFVKNNELDNSLDGSSLFVTEKKTSFTFSVSKEKLKKLVSLKENKHYDKMHEDLLYLFNNEEVKKILHINAVESAKVEKKEYNFIVLHNINDIVNEEQFKKILVQIYKGYEALYLENNHVSRYSNLTATWFNNFYLHENLKVKNESCATVKKI